MLRYHDQHGRRLGTNSDPMKKLLKITVTGRVQGVWYRASTEEKARELGLTGYVKNEPDGSVYIEAEGDEPALDALVAWCRQGPPLARVENLQTEVGTLQHYRQFEQRR